MSADFLIELGTEELPPKSLKKLSNAKMINLIGNQIEPYRQNLKLDENEFFFDYLKKEIKQRKQKLDSGDNSMNLYIRYMSHYCGNLTKCNNKKSSKKNREESI